MYHIFVHTILPAWKHLLSLVHLHTYMIQGHYCTCKVRYSSFLAIKTVAFRASYDKNIYLPWEIQQREKLMYEILWTLEIEWKTMEHHMATIWISLKPSSDRLLQSCSTHLNSFMQDKCLILLQKVLLWKFGDNNTENQNNIIRYATSGM